MKKIIAVLFAIICMAFLVVSISAEDLPYDTNRYAFDDVGGMMTESQLNAIEAKLERAKNETGIDFYFGFVYNTDYINQFMTAHSITQESFVVFLVESTDGTFYYQSHVQGSAEKNISKHEENEILDSGDVHYNIKSGNIVEGVSAFASQASYAYSHKDYGFAVLIGIVFGAIGAAVLIAIVLLKYKMKLQPTNYPLDQFTKTELTEQSDKFITATVTKTVIQSSSNNSRGSSGGSSFSGRSSGKR